MKRRIGACLVVSTGCAMLIGACGGNVQETARGSAGSQNASLGGAGNASSSLGGQHASVPGSGSGNAGSGTSGVGNGAGAAGQGGATEAGPCTGSFDEVAAECPPTLCAGTALAANCSAFEFAAFTEIEFCQGQAVITLDFATHGTVCYYARANFQSPEPKLVGALAWDDVTSHCDGTSFQIETGTVSTDCHGHTDRSQILCDGSGEAPKNVGVGVGAGGAGGAAGEGGDSAPDACFNFNQFDGTCQPCCPTTEPDCTGKPNGYPGYRCTPSAGSYCSCACASEAWSCGC